MNVATFKKSIWFGAIAGAVTALALVLTGAVGAIGEGTIEGGDIYRVRNVTKNTGFANSTTAGKCETLQYKIRIHNPGPGEIKNVNVKVNFPTGASTTHTSTATITAQNSQPASRSDTATVNLSQALNIAYQSGSTQLLDTNSNVIRALPDGITGGGVNIGTVGVSLNEIKFVQFKAKVNCPETPPPPMKSFKCKALNVTQVSRTKFNFTALAEVRNVTIQNYVFTARNQAGATVDTRTVTTSSTSANYQFNHSTPGTYVVSVVINTNAGATNPNDCKREIKVVKEGETPPPQQPPTQPPVQQQQQQQQSQSQEQTTVVAGGSGGGVGGGFVSGSGEVAPEILPDTGPGETAAVVGLVSTISSAGYYMVSRRFN